MTESHLRRLSVTMRAVEEALLAVEAALACAPDVVMNDYEDDIPPPMRPAIRELIQQLRREIQTVKDHYGLDPQAISNRRRVSTKLSLLSIDLTEATSRYMRGFGEVPKHEQRALDDQIDKMISLVDGLNKLIQ